MRMSEKWKLIVRRQGETASGVSNNPRSVCVLQPSLCKNPLYYVYSHPHVYSNRQQSLRTGDLTMAASVHSFHIIPFDSSEVARPGGIWHGTRNSCNGNKRAIRTRSSISIHSAQPLFVFRAVVYRMTVVPPGLYTPDNNSTLFPNVTTKNVCKHCLTSYGGTILSYSSNTVSGKLSQQTPFISVHSG